jgi:Xaa-Pro aminopeptidase
MSRVASSAVEKGLVGVIVTPGPDLVWLTGYRPTAITERLTMFVLSPDTEPTLLVPILERPDAEAAEGVGSLSLGGLGGRHRPLRNCEPTAPLRRRIRHIRFGLGDASAGSATSVAAVELPVPGSTEKHMPDTSGVIVDNRVFRGQLAVIQIYCPDELPQFQQMVARLKTATVAG